MELDDLTDYIWVGVAVIVICFIGFIVAVGTPQYYEEHNVTGIVLDKERIVNGEDSYYLIYTDNETFAIKDSLVKGQWRSSDIYGHIENGKEYEFTVFGVRNGYLSMYRNIISYEEIKN